MHSECGPFSVSIGDLVEVTWLDHFRFKRIAPPKITVKSWGKVYNLDENGIALALNEVQDASYLRKPRSGKPMYERVMDGQFILWTTVENIQILKSGEEQL